LRAWIDQGATMPERRHSPLSRRRWPEREAQRIRNTGRIKPTRPELPPVARTAWPRNELDRFVLARLEREKLSPSPEASKSTLLRRVTLDLTGLPPSPAELDAFLADTATDAYDRVVDRPARLATLRRTVGAPVARPRALRRHERL
jgi:hypothetical protein